MTPKDWGDAARAILEQAGVNLPTSDVSDILNGGYGVIWPTAGSASSPSGIFGSNGNIFIPGIPGGISPGSVTIGTIEEILNSENPIDAIKGMGEEIKSQIITAASDPVGIITGVYEDLEFPEWLILGGVDGLFGDDVEEYIRSTIDDLDPTTPSIPFDGDDEEEEEGNSTGRTIIDDIHTKTPPKTDSDRYTNDADLNTTVDDDEEKEGDLIGIYGQDPGLDQTTVDDVLNLNTTVNDDVLNLNTTVDDDVLNLNTTVDDDDVLNLNTTVNDDVLNLNTTVDDDIYTNTTTSTLTTPPEELLDGGGGGGGKQTNFTPYFSGIDYQRQPALGIMNLPRVDYNAGLFNNIAKRQAASVIPQASPLERKITSLFDKYI